MVKILYKVLSLLLGIVAGTLANKVFDQIWGRIAPEDDGVPEPDERDTTFGKVLMGAAIEGAVFAAVRAAVRRSGAKGVEKVTGQWPGKIAEEQSAA